MTQLKEKQTLHQQGPIIISGAPDESTPEITSMTPDNYKLFLGFLKERENIRHKRASGHPHPWTDDKILRDYRFTNISRKHDRFTVELEKMVKEAMKTHSKKDVVFNILVHRSHSKTETLKRWGWLSGFNDAKNKFLQDKADNITSMTGAFQRCRSTKEFTDSWEFYAENAGKLLEVIGNAKTLKQVYRELKSYPQLGKFMAWQVLSDLKLCGLIPTKQDENTFVVLGPGSLQGIKLMPEHLRNPVELLSAVRTDAPELAWMDIEDIEHSLCEFSKYHRSLTGGGRPRQRYTPNASAIPTK